MQVETFPAVLDLAASPLKGLHIVMGRRQGCTVGSTAKPTYGADDIKALGWSFSPLRSIDYRYLGVDDV